MNKTSHIIKSHSVPFLLYLTWLEQKRLLFGIKHSAELDITDNCNLRCKHCYHFQSKSDFQQEDFPLDIWKERFEKLHARGIRNVLCVGGEPALRQDILFLAEAYFPIINVITNGTIKITKKFDHNIYVSMDGDQLHNDAIRGKGTFSKVIDNYKNDRRVIINMTLTKENYNQLENVVQISRANNFRGVVCNNYIHREKNDKYSYQIISKEIRAKIVAEMRRVKELWLLAVSSG